MQYLLHLVPVPMVHVVQMVYTVDYISVSSVVLLFFNLQDSIPRAFQQGDSSSVVVVEAIALHSRALIDKH